MNDAGNFLIETCDEASSRELKQQLLLMNGRWRDLFVKVKQVSRQKPTNQTQADSQRLRHQGSPNS